MMQYKGYTGRVEFDDKADLFHGEVIGLRDVITFQGRTVDEVKQAIGYQLNRIIRRALQALKVI